MDLSPEERARHIYNELSDPAKLAIPLDDFIAVVASHIRGYGKGDQWNQTIP